MSGPGQPAPRSRYIAIVGNPNSGKTTVFNELTGLRQKVGNYPGVTVEKKEGKILFDDGTEATLLDLPGTYSLHANSPDEAIATDVLLGEASHTRVPELVICVADASNLERNLYLLSQIMDRHLPVVVALNMMDTAEHDGFAINLRALEQELGVPVVPTIANKNSGIKELKLAIRKSPPVNGRQRQWRLPDPLERECDELVALLQQHRSMSAPAAFHEALGLLTTQSSALAHSGRYPEEIIAHVKQDHEKLTFMGIDAQSAAVEARYEWIKSVCARAVTQSLRPGMSVSDRIDHIVTHRVWGLLFFFALMGVMFELIFTWAAVPMAWIGRGFDDVGGLVRGILPPGDLQDLMVNGGIAGVSAVVTFLPQILFLFFFLGILEDSGYMARAAFMMDRLMSKVGLHGRSFIPLLSSFACAIPGIMATRTIENQKDRLATMLVAPLMSCSARLPVYTLLIAAFLPGRRIFGIFSLPGITLFSMYTLGLIAALCVAWVLKKTLLKGGATVFLMELPPYKMPSLKSILLHMWERSRAFLVRAGTIILGVSILLWFLATYPKTESATPSQRLEHSFAGMAGHLIEPAIKPLGFDWKIGIGLISSLLQREVFVSTMGTIYNIQDAHQGEATVSLRQRLREDKDPATGAPIFTPLTAICLMVYYVLAMQCMSTVAIMRRETNGWKWPIFQIGYMTALAWSVTFVVFRVGTFLGIGG